MTGKSGRIKKLYEKNMEIMGGKTSPIKKVMPSEEGPPCLLLLLQHLLWVRNTAERAGRSAR